jgi:sugar phosphate isomerase/epimerase
MQLQIFKTLWGWPGDYGAAAQQAAAAGWQGLEGAVPPTAAAQRELAEVLAAHGLYYIAEICTAGCYVPERRAGLAAHLATLAAGLQACAALKPLFVNCIGGCDAWTLPQHREFFTAAMDLAAWHGVAIAFETHRSRSLFNPWVTAELCACLPELRLTCDFSHWCVVCERLLDGEQDVIDAIAPQAHHIHARVGYAQGPQVPHPAAPEYAPALAAHQRWWECIWRAQHARGYAHSTLTPEFGPDGYLHALPFTQTPVADLEQVNRWMAGTEQRHFRQWAAALQA